MQCAKCPGESVIFQQYSGLHLCKTHFIADVEAKAKRDIRVNGWLRSGDHIGILMTGDKKSLALFHFICRLVASRRDVRVTAIITKGGGGESPGAGTFQHIVESSGITVVHAPADALASAIGEDGESASPVLAGIARENGMTKFAEGRCLDDAALSFLAAILSGKPEPFFDDDWGDFQDLPIITPFMSVPVSEIELYADFSTGACIIPPGERGHDVFRERVRDMLDAYTGRHPATKYSLLQISERIRHAKPGNGTPVRTGSGLGKFSRELCNPERGSGEVKHHGE